MVKPILVLATGNAHKVDEIRSMLGSHFDYLSLKDFPGAPAVVEDAQTFAGNATKKAVELAKWLAETGAAIDKLNSLRGGTSKGSESSVSILADDSGLEVAFLGGAPGVHSARYASLDKHVPGNAPDAANRKKLLLELQETPREKRTARFRCVIAFTPLLALAAESTSPVCYADEHELQIQLFEGSCEGSIGFEERGSGGFGYDSLFIPTGCDQTFAELGEAIKNAMSHRGRALAALKKSLI